MCVTEEQKGSTVQGGWGGGEEADHKDDVTAFHFRSLHADAWHRGLSVETPRTLVSGLSFSHLSIVVKK